jgi:transposase
VSQKEMDRAFALSKVKENQITLKEAAHVMSISYAQTKRLWARYKKEGSKGLISKKRGRRSNRAVSQEERERIAQIIQKNYQGCFPLFTCEKLRQYYQVHYSSEFIRSLMIDYQLWFPKRKKTSIHPRRQRRESAGLLLQADASDHDWFECRGPRCHLHLFIDDATSRIEGGRFELEETTKGYYRALKPVLEKKGRPVQLYTDKRGTFVVNQGKRKEKTQFARAMEELEIEMIIAHSPQAKGRIERAFGTLQKRLVWEMRIRDICTLEEANNFLPKFLEEHNKKYAKRPISPFDAYRPLNKNKPLKYILSKKEKRKVSKNLEVQYEKELYQLDPPNGVQIQNQNITVITTLDNEQFFEYQGHLLGAVRYSDIEGREPRACIDQLIGNWKARQKKAYQPSMKHPWRRAVPNQMQTV